MDNPNYCAPVMVEPLLPSGSNIMRTPLGNVYSTSFQPPPLPPSPSIGDSVNNGLNFGSYPSGFGNSYNSYGSTGYGGYGLSNPFNSGFGGGMFGNGGYGGGFSSYGRGFYNASGSTLNPYDPESRFIQLAQENSRPAFESIGSLVSAVANIAAMLDSTFYAITSSFQAILGVAANFGHLRGVFSQFWQTFAIFRGLTWIYKKLLYWMKISNIDPSSQIFKEAFEVAKNEALGNNSNSKNFNKTKKQSPWPVVIFLSFIFTAPYIVMKLLGNLTSSVVQETKDPRRWVKPIKSVVLYDFEARNPSELTIKAGQTIYIAPKEIQNSQKLLNSGWALATVDALHSGLIPITYCKKINGSPVETNSASVHSYNNTQAPEIVLSAEQIKANNNLTNPLELTQEQINSIKSHRSELSIHKQNLPVLTELNEEKDTSENLSTSKNNDENNKNNEF